MDAKDVKDLIGKPFVDGARGPAAYDCWGICMEVFKRCGYSLPDYPISATDKESISAAIEDGKNVWKMIEQPQAPCVVIMRLGSHTLINHCGVYVGEGKIIHTRNKVGAVIERLDTPLMRRIVKGFALPPKEFKK